LTAGCMKWPGLVGYETRLWFYRHVRLARYVASYLRGMDNCDQWDLRPHETWNVEATRDFFSWAAPRTRLCLFIYPGCYCNYRPFHEGTEVPVMALDAEDLPPEYKTIHPPARVLSWYGVEIAKWLRARGLVPM